MAANPAPWHASLHQASSAWSCLAPGTVQLLPGQDAVHASPAGQSCLSDQVCSHMIAASTHQSWHTRRCVGNSVGEKLVGLW